MSLAWLLLILSGVFWVPLVKTGSVTEDYHTIEEALCRPDQTIGTPTLLLLSNTTYFVRPGNFCVVENAQHIHISGSNLSSPTLVKCLAQNNSYSSRGFAFVNVSFLTFENILFRDCGELYSSNFDPMSDSTIPATLFCNHCSNLTLRNIILENYWGYALVMTNIVGTNLFDKVAILSNRRVNGTSLLCNDKTLGYVCKGSGVLITFSDFVQAGQVFSSVAVYDSDFIGNRVENPGMTNDKGKCSDLSFYDRDAILDSLPEVGAVTIVFRQTLFNVVVKIESSTFVDNKGLCYGGIAAIYLGSPSLSIFNVSNCLFMNNIATYSDISSSQNFFGSAITVFMTFVRDLTQFYNCVAIQNSVFAHNCTNCTTTLFLSISQLPLSEGLCSVTLSNLSSTSESLFLRGESVGMVRQLKFLFQDLKLYGDNNLRKEKYHNYSNNDHGIIELLNIEQATFLGTAPNALVFKNLVGPVISVTRTFVYLQGNISFLSNHATSWTDGAAIRIYDSFLFLSEPTTVIFENNTAIYGGAIYSSSDLRLSPFCSIQYNTCNAYTGKNITKMDTRLIFRKNAAVRGGNSVYVDNLYNCSVKISEGMLFNSKDVDYIYGNIFVFESTVGNGLEEVSSAGNYVCLCLESGFDCTGATFIDNPLLTYPGKTLYFSLIALDKARKPIYSTMFTHAGRNFPYSNDLDWSVSYGQDVVLLHTSSCKNVSFNVLSGNDTEKHGILNMYLRDSNEAMDIPIFLQNCPLGLQKYAGEDSCTCPIQFQNVGVSCNVDEGTVTIPPNTWIGVINLGNNETVVGFSNHCPIIFCKHKMYTVLLEKTTVCTLNREGVLCGQCSPPYSEVIGDYHCQRCSNWFLLVIIVFGIVGVLLVFFIFYLKLTLASGAVNGVVFYANFLYVNKVLFLGTPELIWLQIFFSFINLRLGFPLCLYDGLTSIVSSHLAFVFPIYLWIIAISLVVMSRYSSKASDLFGRSSVRVLATLIHLSYSTLLACTVDGLTVNDIVYEDENGNRFNRKVWYLDGNMGYFTAGHISLFLLATINLTVFLLPYTILLTGIKFFARFRIVNRFMPLIDVYCAPYKDKWRFWFGARLLVLVILYTGSALLRNHNPGLFFMMIVVLVCFTVVQLIIMPFKNYFINLLDAFFLLNAILLSATALFADDIDSLRKGTGSLIALAFLVSVGVLVYHIWYTRCKSCRQFKIPRKLTYNRITETGPSTGDSEIKLETDRSNADQTIPRSQPVTFHVLSYHPEKLRESVMDYSTSPAVQNII